MTPTSPNAITRFAREARVGLDAMALRLLASGATPPLDTPALARLADLATNLGLDPFAESLTATQLTIDALTSAGMAADPAAGEHFAELLLQLQLAAEELESGNALAAISTTLLDQTRELLTLAGSPLPAQDPATPQIAVPVAQDLPDQAILPAEPVRPETDSTDNPWPPERSTDIALADCLPIIDESAVQSQTPTPPFETPLPAHASSPDPASIDSDCTAELVTASRDKPTGDPLPEGSTAEHETLAAAEFSPQPDQHSASDLAASAILPVASQACTDAAPIFPVAEPATPTEAAAPAPSAPSASSADARASSGGGADHEAANTCKEALAYGAAQPPAVDCAATGSGVNQADATSDTQQLMAEDLEAAAPAESGAIPHDQPVADHAGLDHAELDQAELDQAKLDLASPPATLNEPQPLDAQSQGPVCSDVIPALPPADPIATETPPSEIPNDTNWQQTDEDLTQAASAMGIGFTEDGAAPVPQCVSLDQLGSRIQELLTISADQNFDDTADTAPEMTASAMVSAEMSPAAPPTPTTSISPTSQPEIFPVLPDDHQHLEAVTPLSDASDPPAPLCDQTTPEVPAPRSADDESSPVVSMQPTEILGEPLAVDAQLDSNPAAGSDPELIADAGGPAELTPEQMAALMAGGDDFDSGMPLSDWGSFPVTLTPEQAESLQFMVADAKAGIEQLSGAISQLSSLGGREEAASSITEIAASLAAISETFNFSSLRSVVGLLNEVAAQFARVSDPVMPELLVRARAIHSLIEQHIRGLECGMEVRWSLDTLVLRTRRLLSGKLLHPSLRGWHRGEPERVLELDLVNEAMQPPPRPDSEETFVEDGSVWIPPATSGTGDTSGQAAGETDKKRETEQMIRVAATTIDGMLDLISQLVLTKNRVFNLSRTLREPGSTEVRLDELTVAADELAVLTGSLQRTMMQARMQPVSKLFERYSRVISDLAGLADKQVNLLINDQSAMIDKNLFDGLAEALSQLLRSIVTRQVRTPSERTSQSKPGTATITLGASSQGAQIIIAVEHDGDPPDHATLAATAVEKNICDADSLDTISDNDLFLLAFKPEFGDPQLSKVGSLVSELGGKLGVRITDDGLTRIEIALPLSVAIVPAILVGIGAESYAVPLQSVEEIIRIADFHCSTVHGKPVLRLRDALLDVVSASAIIGQAGPAPSAASEPVPSEFAESAEATGGQPSSPGADQPAPQRDPHTFGLVIASGFSRAVLTVDRIIGKQEIVIKKLEGTLANIRSFAGATIRNDGSISLIFDVAELLKAAP